MGNIGEGLLWLNLFLGNKMNHENVTDQIDALAEDLQVTKDTLLQKLKENTDTLQALEDILNQTNSGPVEDLLDIEVSEILESELNTTSSDDDITSILAEVLIPSRVNLTNEETQVIQNEEDETEELAVDFLNEILLTAINKRRRKTRV